MGKAWCHPPNNILNSLQKKSIGKKYIRKAWLVTTFAFRWRRRRTICWFGCLVNSKIGKKCIQSTVAVEEEILVEKSLKKSERILRKMAIFPNWKKIHTTKQLFKIKSISSSSSSSNRISHYRKNLQLNFLTHLDSWMDDKWWFGNFYTNTFNLLSFLCQLKWTF